MSKLNPDETYHLAVKEHAWSLRLDGLKYLEIAERIGLSPQAAHQKVKQFSRRMNRAMRRARFKVLT
jgi:hypothetical protein